MPLGDLHLVQEQGWGMLESLLLNVFIRNLPTVVQKVLRDTTEFGK